MVAYMMGSVLSRLNIDCRKRPKLPTFSHTDYHFVINMEGLLHKMSSFDDLTVA